MGRYMIFAVLFTMLIGTSLAENANLGSVTAFKQALEKDGFTVQQGELGFYDVIKLYNLGLLPSAWGNNPTTKYIAYFVPAAPGYNVDKKPSMLAKALGFSGNATAYFRLRPDEAIVFVGRTPPECRYFNFDINLFYRVYGNETLWPWFDLGDPLNMEVIKTEGTPNGTAGNPFNQTTMIVTTADKGIDQRIRAAAQSVGYPDGIINTQVVPSHMLNMGLENNSDTFCIYIRPALFKDKQAGNDYTCVFG